MMVTDDKDFITKSDTVDRIINGRKQDLITSWDFVSDDPYTPYLKDVNSQRFYYTMSKESTTTPYMRTGAPSLSFERIDANSIGLVFNGVVVLAVMRDPKTQEVSLYCPNGEVPGASTFVQLLRKRPTRNKQELLEIAQENFLFEGSGPLEEDVLNFVRELGIDAT